MNIKPYPTQKRLKALFDYSEDSYVKSGIVFVGGLVWKPRRDSLGRPNTRELGKFAGTANVPQKRVQVAIDTLYYELHRLVWIWHFGAIAELVDHRSRSTTDNRIGNLRPSSFSGNNANRSLVGGSSKYVGVYLNARGKWIAQIKKDRKVQYLGSFDSEIAAAKARDAATLRVHGEFGVLNNA